MQVHTDGTAPVVLGAGPRLATISGNDLVTATISPPRDPERSHDTLQITRRPLNPS